MSFSVGDTVISLFEMTSDLREDGMGIQLCARAGEKLVIRKVCRNNSGEMYYHVSRTAVEQSIFTVEHHEIKAEPTPIFTDGIFAEEDSA